ncbi:WUSCHEL related homeobox 11 [Striga asiatica]|uniref:WUSCHEL related homeobox 11 n=1 Tax=Striga asiatica TaxID=4170 RepID=A0A5A7QVH7_STRAF|nr:WUSCHEL related homeobox 11 [Striga asiatica]
MGQPPEPPAAAVGPPSASGTPARLSPPPPEILEVHRHRQTNPPESQTITTNSSTQSATYPGNPSAQCTASVAISSSVVTEPAHSTTLRRRTPSLQPSVSSSLPSPSSIGEDIASVDLSDAISEASLVHLTPQDKGLHSRGSSNSNFRPFSAYSGSGSRPFSRLWVFPVCCHLPRRAG